jgi:hypothetical protein
MASSYGLRATQQLLLEGLPCPTRQHGPLQARQRLPVKAPVSRVRRTRLPRSRAEIVQGGYA